MHFVYPCRDLLSHMQAVFVELIRKGRIHHPERPRCWPVADVPYGFAIHITLQITLDRYEDREHNKQHKN